jgi:hypothetical protein
VKNASESRDGYQGCNSDHRSRWTNLTEEFAVRFADFFPVSDVGYVHARAYNVFQTGACFLDSRLNIFERLDCLGIGIACDNFSIRSGSCSS